MKFEEVWMKIQGDFRTKSSIVDNNTIEPQGNVANREPRPNLRGGGGGSSIIFKSLGFILCVMGISE